MILREKEISIVSIDIKQSLANLNGVKSKAKFKNFKKLVRNSKWFSTAIQTDS